MNYRYDEYLTIGRDMNELNWLAGKYGYDNPGPIVAFPGNEHIFNTRTSPGPLPGDVILLIPWSPAVLRRLILTHRHLADQAIADANRAMNSETVLKEDIEALLTKIDAIGLLASLAAGIAVGAVDAAKGVTAEKMTAWLLENQLATARDLSTLIVPTPHPPRKGVSFFLRHTLGPWTPSFWTGVYAALKTGDSNIYLFGAGAVAHENKLKIKRNAEVAVVAATRMMRNLNAQLEDPCYSYRV